MSRRFLTAVTAVASVVGSLLWIGPASADEPRVVAGQYAAPPRRAPIAPLDEDRVDERNERERKEQGSRRGDAVQTHGFHEAGLVNELNDQCRRRSGATTCQHEYFVERLHRFDQGEHQHDHQVGQEQGERDARERAPRRGFIKLCRLVLVTGNRLQALKQNERVEPHVRPN